MLTFFVILNILSFLETANDDSHIATFSQGSDSDTLATVTSESTIEESIVESSENNQCMMSNTKHYRDYIYYCESMHFSAN